MSLQTSLYSGDSTENIKADTKTETAGDGVQNRHSNLITSTTPLEPDKNHAWRSVDNLQQTKNEHQLVKSESNEIDQEFDMFTKERVEKNTQIRKSSQLQEPSVLVLNVPNNLGTLREDEEKTDEINAVISETASSITQFCKKNFIHSSDVTDSTDKALENKQLEKNPFHKELHQAHDVRKIIDIKDPLLNMPIQTNPLESQTETVEPKVLQNDINKNLAKVQKPLELKLNKNEGNLNSLPENKAFLRDRSASIGTLNLKTPLAHLIGEQNRTMLFQVRFLIYKNFSFSSLL